jgi:hypothetical protein
VGIDARIGYPAAGGQTMTERTLESFDRLIQAERDRMENEVGQPSRPQELHHHSELPPDDSGGEAARDWNCYLREAGRLIAEGHEGKWVLIKSATIIGVWETAEEARATAANRFLMEPVLIHRIREREPVLRAPTFLLRCRN